MQRFMGTRLRKHIKILGEGLSSDELRRPYIKQKWARKRFDQFLEARGIDSCVLVEDLRHGSTPWADHERQSESTKHNLMLKETIASLLRLGYRVYPGGAGVNGQYCLADALAFAPSGMPLLIECLTKFSIKRDGHLRKLPFASVVPTCFVGELPESFLQHLPTHSYAIPHPFSPRTLLTMTLPLHYRTTFDAPIELVIYERQSRNGRKLRLEMPNLLLQEDTSAFIHCAVTESLRQERIAITRSIKGPNWNPGDPGYCLGPWRVTSPHARSEVPFSRHGRSYSALKISVEDSTLTLALGRNPIIGECRGTSSALDVLERWLVSYGIPTRRRQGR